MVVVMEGLGAAVARYPMHEGLVYDSRPGQWHSLIMLLRMLLMVMVHDICGLLQSLHGYCRCCQFLRMLLLVVVVMVLIVLLLVVVMVLLLIHGRCLTDLLMHARVEVHEDGRFQKVILTVPS